jgi:hypothetical protein
MRRRPRSTRYQAAQDLIIKTQIWATSQKSGACITEHGIQHVPGQKVGSASVDIVACQGHCNSPGGVQTQRTRDAKNRIRLARVDSNTASEKSVENVGNGEERTRSSTVSRSSSKGKNLGCDVDGQGDYGSSLVALEQKGVAVLGHAACGSAAQGLANARLRTGGTAG